MKLNLIVTLVASASAIQLLERDIAGRDKGDNHDNSLVENQQANHCSYSEHLRMCVIDEVQMNSNCVMAPENTHFLVTAENKCTWNGSLKTDAKSK